MDSTFTIVDSVRIKNGFIQDGHDMQILPNGHFLLLGWENITMDLSSYAIFNNNGTVGSANATVRCGIVQEQDANKNVVFEWRSWDHFEITDAVHENLTASRVDYVHGNAIELDYDGNLLISSRHLSEITKINRSTGNIIWRLGGVNNQFTFLNDTIGFSYQHHIRRISNGNVTLFDNGNFHSPAFSRAIEYQLDEVNKIATLVWQYRKTPDVLGYAMGSVQRLKTGNTFICWGSTNPNFTEVTPSGTIALEMSLPFTIYSYRGYKEELSMSLNMSVIVEGFYNSSTDRMNIRDTVTAYLRSTSSPFSIVDSARAVIDSVNMTGNFNFYNTYTGNYYISLKHRNALETWSKSGGEFLVNGTVQNYNMTDLSSKAYGNNIVQVDNSPVKFALYSGDVNKDSFIDLTDVIYIFNDAGSFVSGYKISDLTGNNITDLADMLIGYNNAVNFISVMRP